MWIMDKKRLEAFSDGVLAIIITIMVLALKQPVGDSWNNLLAILPTVLVYFVSFLFIAIFWVNHSFLFQKIGKISTGILWCNIAWLFVISFIPFVTEWAGSNPDSFAPLCLYFVDIFVTNILFHVMYFLVLREQGERARLRLADIVSLIVYGLSAVFGAYCPAATFIIVLFVSVWLITAKRKG